MLGYFGRPTCRAGSSSDLLENVINVHFNENSSRGHRRRDRYISS